MPGRTSGLQRDLNLVRRRAGLFIPFFFLGIVAALAFGSFAGKANAVASMQLETVVHTVLIGGDRGFRIFEAQSMTGDDGFRKKVVDRIGDPNFDYSRFAISLAPISVADGVSRGILTVSIQDDDKVKAEKYRQAFVDVFAQEYTATDGIFRTRFVGKQQQVLDDAETTYQATVKALKALPQAASLPLDKLAVNDRQPIQEYNKQEADLQRQLGEVKGAADQVASGKFSAETNTALASSVLGVAVAGDPRAALAARQGSLEAALAGLRQQMAAFSDLNLDPVTVRALDAVRGADLNKYNATQRLENVRAAVASAESTISTSYSFSGGVAGTLVGRVAIVIAVTLVFGLIAIYGLEWLMQVRTGSNGAVPDANR